MEKDGARQFYALKADLEAAVLEAEKGNFAAFDPKAYEPDAFTDRSSTTKYACAHLL